MNNKCLNVLVVDDDDVAAEAVVRSLSKARVELPTLIAEDGQAALDILRGEDAERKLMAPPVVLLDLNMPRMSGFEFLEAIRQDEMLQKTVVFVLTTSEADRDISRAYHCSIAGYLVKSAVGPQFSKVTHLLENYAEAVRLAGN